MGHPGMRIPPTDSIQELADFWDTPQRYGFDDQLEEVSEPVFARQLAHTVRVTLHAARGVEEAA